LKGTGQGAWLWTATSDIDFLGDLEGVVDLDAEVANGCRQARSCPERGRVGARRTYESPSIDPATVASASAFLLES
jgi:hypothetical protein